MYLVSHVLPHTAACTTQLVEEYERQRTAEEEAKKKQYEEEVARNRNVRPHQIIAGEFVIKPPANHSPPREGRDVSPVRFS